MRYEMIPQGNDGPHALYDIVDNELKRADKVMCTARYEDARRILEARKAAQ